MTVLDWTGKRRSPSMVHLLAWFSAAGERQSGRFAWTPESWRPGVRLRRRLASA